MSGHIWTPQAIENALFNFQASHYLAISSATVLFYDYLLCLASEITYVWRSPLSLPIILYYTVRYLPMAWTIVGIYHIVSPGSDLFCRVYIPGQLLAQAFTYIPATWLLSIRVLALYQYKRCMTRFVYGTLIVTHIALMAVGSVALYGVKDSMNYSSVIRDCYTSHAPRLLGYALLLLLPLEVLLITLQLNHSIGQRHLLRDTASISFPILRALYMDGSMYFLLVFSMRLWTGLMLVIGSDSLFYLSIFTEYAFTSNAISRLFIHLRSVARHHNWGHVSQTHDGQEPTSATITARRSELNSTIDPFGSRRGGSIPMVLQLPVIESRTEVTYS